MTGFKTILMTGAAIVALTACSSDRGPGAIGTADDIIVRNAGEPKAPPPKPLDAPAVVAADAAVTDGVTAAPAPAVEAAPAAVAAETTATTVPATPAVPAEPQPAATPTPASPAAADPVTEVAVATTPVPAPAPESVPVVKADTAPMKNIPMATSETAPASAPVAPVPAATPATPAETNAAPAVPTAPPETPVAQPATAPVDMSMAALQSGDKATIMAVQEELKKAGLYTGKADGKINTETLNAMIRYQSSQGTLAKVPASVTAPASASAAAKPAPLPPAGQAKPAAAPAAVAAPVATAAPVVPAVSAPVAAITAQTPMTDPALIRAVQEKLKAQGLLPSVSGAMDSATLNALVKYQTSNGLTPGALNLDTVKKLGIVQ